MAAMKSSGRVRASIAVIASAIAVAALVALYQVRHASRESGTVALPSRVDGTASAAARSAPATQADTAALPAPVVDASVVACERKLQSLGIDEHSEQVGMGAFEREARYVEDRAVASMLASTDPRTSAAADFWLALQADLASLVRAGCEPDDEACGRHATETRARGEGAAERLVRKAMRTGDPVVYGWAFQVCRQAAADAPSCQLVSAAQWARLSPGNAFAWFAAAEEASARKNAAALDAAMFQIASADRVDSATFVLPGLLADHSIGDGSDALVAAALAVSAIYMSAANDFRVSTPSTYCNGAALMDANRRQICEKTAELFVSRSDTLLVRGVGVGLGKRLGWPEARLRALHDERDALNMVSGDFSDVISDVIVGSACRTAVSVLRRIPASASLGELGALRQRRAASGKTVDELAAQWRERLRRMSAAPDAERAASAASAAASASAQAASSPNR